MAGDWIQLHRSVITHWVFADDAMFYLWSNLLLRANWKEGKFWPGGASAPVIIGRGQLITGRNALHAMLYPERDAIGSKIRRETNPPHPTTVWRWLEAMEKDGMIALDVRKAFTIVTICNYETYQGSKSTSAHAMRNGRATGAQVTRNTCATGAPPVRTIEEETNKGNKGNKGNKEEKVATLPLLLQTDDFQAAWDSWEQHRRELKKPLKPTMAVAQLKHLAEMGHDRAIACIRHTITMGWQGLREPESSNGHAPAKKVRLPE